MTEKSTREFMTPIWVDDSLLGTGTGIARDGWAVVNSLKDVFKIKFLSSVLFFSPSNKFFRRIMGLFFLFFSVPTRMSDQISGILYQPQISSVVPGKGISVWLIRIHDIFPITNPGWFRFLSAYKFKKAWKMALKGRAIFVCSSDYMKNLILQLFPSLLGRIEVVPCVPQVLSTILCDNCSGCDLSKSSFVANNYFIAVGTIEPRKNYSFMIEGWKAAKKQSDFNSQLLIVGGKGWKCRRLLNSFRYSTSMLNQDIIWLDSCCDGALALFYANSKAFVSTSLDEGFNLPAMEAREFFCIPLILSNIPVHRELHSDVAYFFEGSKEFMNIICSVDFDKARKCESFERRNTPINDMKMVIYNQMD